jgi:hypothetical protein
MYSRKFLSTLVIVAFLGATELHAFADDGMDSLVIIGPAIAGVALLITLVAVIGTRSKEKPLAETPGSNAYAALPAQNAESPATPTAGPRYPVPAGAVNPSASRGASSFALICPQGSAGIAVACW